MVLARLNSSCAEFYSLRYDSHIEIRESVRLELTKLATHNRLFWKLNPYTKSDSFFRNLLGNDGDSSGPALRLDSSLAGLVEDNSIIAGIWGLLKAKYYLVPDGGSFYQILLAEGYVGYKGGREAGILEDPFGITA